jgi:hypothetical protein
VSASKRRKYAVTPGYGVGTVRPFGVNEFVSGEILLVKRRPELVFVTPIVGCGVKPGLCGEVVDG